MTGGESEGLSLPLGGSRGKLVPLPLDEMSGELSSHHGDGGCSESNLGSTLGPWRAGVKEKTGAPGDWGIDLPNHPHKIALSTCHLYPLSHFTLLIFLLSTYHQLMYDMLFA